jgi:hypothetical protein
MRQERPSRPPTITEVDAVLARLHLTKDLLRQATAQVEDYQHQIGLRDAEISRLKSEVDVVRAERDTARAEVARLRGAR